MEEDLAFADCCDRVCRGRKLPHAQVSLLLKLNASICVTGSPRHVPVHASVQQDTRRP